MKIKRILSAVLLAGLAFGARAGEYTQYVNTSIGTGGHGHVFYGANVPFGLVQLGPTMVTRGWDWCSGYHISDKFIIGSPLFEKAALNVGNGKTFTISAKNNSDKNVYVQRVMLNGKPYTKSYISYDDIIKGGTLELVMGPKPSKWGTAKADRP